MKLGIYKRVKHGETSGSLHRSHIIAMREGNHGFEVFPWYTIGWAQMKALNRYMKEKTKTVQRRRDKRAVNDWLEEEGDA